MGGRRTGGRCTGRGRCPRRGGPAGSCAWSLLSTLVQPLASQGRRLFWGLGNQGRGDKCSPMPRARESRLCSPHSANGVTLRLPTLAGRFQGQIPAFVAWGGAEGDWLGVLRREKPPLPGLMSPSWGRRGGEKGSRGVWFRPGALLQASEGRMPQDLNGSLGGHTPPPLLFPPPPTSPGRRRWRPAPRDLSGLVTEEEDLFPPCKGS